MASLQDVKEPANAVAVTGKRKRGQRKSDDTFSQLEEFLDETFVKEENSSDVGYDDVETESDQDATYGKRTKLSKKQRAKRAKKAETASVKKKKKPKSFPFMQLPPELRNQVYEYALVAKDMIVSTRKHKFGRDTFRRRCIRHSRAARCHVCLRNLLSPGLLAVSKQTHEEAVKYLYGQHLRFSDMLTLHHFLATVGLEKRKLLTNVCVDEWMFGQSQNALMALPAMTLLSDCVQLQSLHLGTIFEGPPKWVARKLFNVGVHFFYRYGLAHGNKFAGIEILSSKSWGSEVDADYMEAFRNELKRLLELG